MSDPRSRPAAAEAAARRRAFLRLLTGAGRARVAAFAVLITSVGLLPMAVMVLAGALVHSVSGAQGHRSGGSAILALAGLLSVLALLVMATHALTQLSRVLDAAFTLELHHEVAAVMLGSPGIAPLEEPALADELQAVQDAERRDVLRWPASAFANVATARLRGIGASVLLLGFAWWAPLLLAAAWALTNRAYWKATENGVSVGMSDGAVRLRRAEYLRSLAVDAPAAKELRVFGLAGWVVGRYGEAWKEAVEVMWRGRHGNRGLTAAAALALAVSHAVVLGALAAAVGNAAVGGAALIVYVQAVIATSELGMVGDWQWFLSRALAVAGVVARMRSRVPAPAPDGKCLPAVPQSGRTAVRLDGVRFTYRGRERPTLDGLTLDIPAGQSLAIVGENGAGKSTLIKLLCGLYEPDEGRITLDGHASPLESRGRIAVIFQDFVRYRLPLRENVGFGHLPLLSDAGVLEHALEAAGGTGLAAALPRRWDTVLSSEFDGGSDLSGGEWQRVALARALVAVRGGAGLLILDEPTASLDVRAETELFDRFLDVTRGVTTILVSHRLSSVRRADRIVVVHDGRVVEDGTHAELMRTQGRYARMYSLQARRFTEGEGERLDAETAHA